MIAGVERARSRAKATETLDIAQGQASLHHRAAVGVEVLWRDRVVGVEGRHMNLMDPPELGGQCAIPQM